MHARETTLSEYKVVTDAEGPIHMVQADSYEWVPAVVAVGEASPSSLLLRFSRQGGEVVAEFNADHVISVEAQEEKQPQEPRRYA